MLVLLFFCRPSRSRPSGHCPSIREAPGRASSALAKGRFPHTRSSHGREKEAWSEEGPQAVPVGQALRKRTEIASSHQLLGSAPWSVLHFVFGDYFFMGIPSSCTCVIVFQLVLSETFLHFDVECVRKTSCLVIHMLSMSMKFLFSKRSNSNQHKSIIIWKAH